MKNKQGVSLIVLVITIIVMIILAAAVMISLSNAGIIGKANEAVNENDLKEAQNIAALAWSDWYLNKQEDSDYTESALSYVTAELGKYGITSEDYIIRASEDGVEVLPYTLGNLISDPTEDYGKLVDYEANGVTEWQVFYEDEKNGYVFLISSGLAEESTEEESIITGEAKVVDLTTEELALYNKFLLGNANAYKLADTKTIDGTQHTMLGCKKVAELIKNYGNYANKAEYGSYVIGAIGGPTIELLVAGWNAQRNETMTITTGDYGYYINGSSFKEVTADELYVPADYYYYLASPDASNERANLNAGFDGMEYTGVGFISSTDTNGVRPVVCLKASTPAIATANGYKLIIE